MTTPADFECRRALSLVRHAHELLQALVDSGDVPDGSPASEARHHLQDAINMLSP